MSIRQLKAKRDVFYRKAKEENYRARRGKGRERVERGEECRGLDRGGQARGADAAWGERWTLRHAQQPLLLPTPPSQIRL